MSDIENITSDIIIEACCETLEEVLHAQDHGAHQIELCDQLDLDGLTPILSAIKNIQAKCDLPIKYMIRNRAGDFIYAKEDIKTMLASIHQLKKMGADHFVLGALLPNSTLDIGTISILCQAAFPHPVTIHKCIDQSIRIIDDITRLKSIPNVKYILTSGGAATAKDGIEKIREMIACAKPEIQIISAGKITASNLAEHINQIRGKYYHGRQIV